MSEASDIKKRAEVAVEFLEKAGRYFANRPTGGEDMAHWANVYNAKNCRDIADLISTLVSEADPLYQPIAEKA